MLNVIPLLGGTKFFRFVLEFFLLTAYGLPLNAVFRFIYN